MGIIIVFVAILIFLCKKNSRMTFALSFLYLWMVFGLSSFTVDRGIYEGRYYDYDSQWMSSITEPLYTFTMWIFHQLNFDLVDLYLSLSFIFLCSLYFYIHHHAVNRCTTIAFILISIYPLQMCLLRITYAFTFVLLGIHILLYTRYKYRVIAFFALLLVASLIHSVCILYSFMLLPYFIPVKKHKMIFLICLCGGILFTVSVESLPELLAFMKIEDFDLSKKSEVFLEDTASSSNRIITYLLALLRVLSVVLLPIGLFFILRLKRKLYLLTGNDRFILTVNYFSLLFAPMLYISHDLYRIFFVIAILNFCMASRLFYIRGCRTYVFVCVLNVGYWFIWRPYFKLAYWDVYMSNYVYEYVYKIFYL